MQSARRFFCRTFVGLKNRSFESSFLFTRDLARQCSEVPGASAGLAPRVPGRRTKRDLGKQLKGASKDALDTDKVFEFLLQQGLVLAKAVTIAQAIHSKRSGPVTFKNFVAVIRYLQTIDIPADKSAPLLKKARFMFARDVETHLKPNLEFLESLGVERKALNLIVLRYPYSLYPELENLQAQVQFLKSIPLDDEYLPIVIARHPDLLRLKVEKYLRPKVEFFKSLGFPISVLKKAFHVCPRIFNMTADKVFQVVELLEELGFKKGSRGFSAALITVATRKYDTVRLGLKNLVSMGFSRQQVELIFQKQPHILGKGAEDIAKKIKYLLEVMERPLEQVVHFPFYLTISLEKRIQPRHEALVKWKTENQVCKEYALSYMYCQTDAAFYKRFAATNG